MRIPPFYRYMKLMRFGAVFLCGMVVGAAVYNGMYHYQFNQLTTIRSELLTQIGQQEEEIKALEKYKHRETIIRKLQIYILDHPNKPIDIQIENELKEKIRDDLNSLVGRSISKINSDAILIQQILRNKIYQVPHGEQYAVQIRTMLANDGLLQIWVEAVAKTNPPLGNMLQ